MKWRVMTVMMKALVSYGCVYNDKTEKKPLNYSS